MLPAAVIPSPIAYIIAVAVKKLVVDLLVGAIGPTLFDGTRIISDDAIPSECYVMRHKEDIRLAATSHYGGEGS